MYPKIACELPPIVTVTFVVNQVWNVSNTSMPKALFHGIYPKMQNTNNTINATKYGQALPYFSSPVKGTKSITSSSLTLEFFFFIKKIIALSKKIT